MDFNKMSNKLLQNICDYLTFTEISKLRGLSKNINSTVRQILNAAFLDLGPRLATQYTSYLINTKNNCSENPSEDGGFRGRLLKLLSSEHSILLAFCRHYITFGVRCFSAGEILDLFYEFERNEFSRESPNEENKKVAKLILLIDQYLDWFEKYRMTSEKNCPWFGACVIDLLDSYQSSKYHLSVSQNGSLIRLAGQYTIIGDTEAPPEIGNPLGCEISQYELLQVLKYLRKHARWHNFVKTFQENSEDDFSLEQEKIYTKRTSSGYDIFYKKIPHGSSESQDNAISIRAVVSLQCHKSLAPARLCNRHDFKNFLPNDDRKLMKNISKDSMMKESKDLEIIVENSCSPLRLISSRTIALKIDNRRKDEIYNFGLELKSIYAKKWKTGSNDAIGEKFGETTLNINQNFDNIFAAKSQFRLY